jgi:hypothetical protein
MRQEGGGRRMTKSEFSDNRFAHAVDALLWVSPSGEHLDNAANYKAVKQWLGERAQAVERLHALVDAVLSVGSWRQHPSVAAPLLEAVVFLDWLAGNRDSAEVLFDKGEGQGGGDAETSEE